jgi:hypothetical protein
VPQGTPPSGQSGDLKRLGVLFATFLSAVFQIIYLALETQNMKAITWNTYMDLHRPVESGKVKKKVVAGMMKGKTRNQKLRLKQEVEDRLFWQRMSIRGLQVVGTITLTIFMYLTFAPESLVEIHAQEIKKSIAQIGKPNYGTYKINEIPKPLLSAVGTREVGEVQAAPEPTPEPTPTPEPVKDKAYYMEAIREEAKKAGVKPALAERLIVLIDKCENSRWDPKATHDNRKEDGTVWSTDYGITMINDYWHAGRVEEVYGLPYKQVLTDGELSVHYAVHYILKPQQNASAWACDEKLTREGVLKPWK